MNSFVKSLLLCVTLGVSTLAYPWAFPFGAGGSMSLPSWPSWQFSKPAWVSSTSASVASTCDLIGSSTKSVYNSAGDSINGACNHINDIKTQAGQTFDRQAAPSWNNSEVLKVGVFIAAALAQTMYIGNKYWQCRHKREIDSQRAGFEANLRGLDAQSQENIQKRDDQITALNASITGSQENMRKQDAELARLRELLAKKDQPLQQPNTEKSMPGGDTQNQNSEKQELARLIGLFGLEAEKQKANREEKAKQAALRE